MHDNIVHRRPVNTSVLRIIPPTRIILVDAIFYKRFMVPLNVPLNFIWLQLPRRFSCREQPPFPVVLLVGLAQCGTNPTGDISRQFISLFVVHLNTHRCQYSINLPAGTRRTRKGHC